MACEQNSSSTSVASSQLCTKCGSKWYPSHTIGTKFVKTPFTCNVCHSIVFPARATRDIVFIYQIPLPKMVGNFHLPDKLRDMFEKGYGVVLSIGPGFWYKNNKKKKWMFKGTSLQVGDYVIFNKDVPLGWSYKFKGVDEEDHLVRFMGEMDVWIVKDLSNEEIDEINKYIEDNKDE